MCIYIRVCVCMWLVVCVHFCAFMHGICISVFVHMCVHNKVFAFMCCKSVHRYAQDIFDKAVMLKHVNACVRECECLSI